MLTRCPACATTFRVVADQLRVSDGWVRCGQCGEVFEASTVGHEQALAADANVVEPPVAAEPPLPEPEPAPEPEDIAEPPALPLLVRPAAERTDGDAPIRCAAQPAPRPAEPAPSAEPALPEVSFIRPEPAPEVAWRRSLRRALWVFAALTLTGALLAQVALHERDRIATAMPAARPWLAALCRAAGCSIQPLREIASIVIDDVSFSALREDLFRLQLRLRNRADHALAWPAVELSLTDIQNQPVLRRVLLPAELGATSGVLPARGEWSGAVDLAVADNAGRARIVGYRVLPFYP